MISNMKSIEISFTKQHYIGYVAVVTTNSILSQVQNRMHYSDYAASFGNHNYGCKVMIQSDDCDTNNTYNSLITSKEVMYGKLDDIQIWRSGAAFCNVYHNFCDRRKTNQGIIVVLNILFLEVYSDRIQYMYLIHCYYRSTIIM